MPEFLEMTFEETGDQLFTDRASSLQQDKATEVAQLKGQQEAQREAAQGRGDTLSAEELGRDIGMLV